MRRGFVLIEVLAVLVVLALLTTLAALAMGRQLRLACGGGAQQLIGHLDSVARQRARQSGTALSLLYDLDRRSIALAGGESLQAAQPFVLPRGWSIQRVLSGGWDRASGQLAVEYNGQGQSDSYAVVLGGPEGRQTVLLVAGLSGQIRECANEAQAEAIFKVLTSQTPPARIDAR